ncbi:MAG: LPXTG cell wall anchor domain-containing protein [Tyzzerella sp.]|nr:LPXTG cell wall anchor domain-containing protein [Tyzzerella sp.]
MKSNLLKRITAVLLCMVIGLSSSIFVIANEIEDRYYTGLRQVWGAGQTGTSVVNGEPLEGQPVTCLDYAALYDKGELAGTAFADKIQVHVNETLPSDYGANGLVLGLQAAETVVPFAPDGFDCNSTGIYDDTATFDKCTNAIFLVGEIGTGGVITPTDDLRGKIGVLYKNIGTYYGKHVDMKVTVSDYVVNADDNYRYNFKQEDGTYKTRYNAVIGLYTTVGKPGITVRNIPWVALTYEFFETGTATPISIKGNTSYYDIDEFQAVFLDDTCKGIYVTDGEVEGSYVDKNGVSQEVTLESGAHNRCVLNLGWFDNLSSGVGVYSGYSEGVSSYISDVYTANGFTEVFEGSKMTRTFSFQNANYPNATSNAPDGNIGHSGRPVNENAVLYELPSTGGHGTYWYTCGGLVFMLGAALMIIKKE